jgi:hypothetical protein
MQFFVKATVVRKKRSWETSSDIQKLMSWMCSGGNRFVGAGINVSVAAR